MDFVTLFENATVAGIPLLIFVLALVQWVKTHRLCRLVYHRGIRACSWTRRVRCV
jgi:hypothetical protein